MNKKALSFLDAHTHVNFSAFKDDYKEVIQRALANGVGVVNVGTQLDTSKRALEIAHEFKTDPVYAAVGLHPVHTSKSFHDKDELGGDKSFTSRGEVFDFDAYKKLASDPKVVAIGECGLDYYRKSQSEKIKNQNNGVAEQHFREEDWKMRQREAFTAQIELAHEVKKPLMIHCRNAYQDTLSALKSSKAKLHSPHPGIIHFFAGGIEEAREFLNLGFYFTFGGVITFVRDYDEVIKFIPTDRVLTETDAPYVTPSPHRGKRNEPSYVIEVLKQLSSLWKLDTDEAAALLLKNAKTVLPSIF